MLVLRVVFRKLGDVLNEETNEQEADVDYPGCGGRD
jgi:hypothetical protein